eukprot:12853340-Heterocapsa_arctica.AAC.1
MDPSRVVAFLNPSGSPSCRLPGKYGEATRRASVLYDEMGAVVGYHDHWDREAMHTSKPFKMSEGEVLLTVYVLPGTRDAFPALDIRRGRDWE